ncbi:unnamed protein product, partial [Larinioides sclopetarius]
ATIYSICKRTDTLHRFLASNFIFITGLLIRRIIHKTKCRIYFIHSKFSQFIN